MKELSIEEKAKAYDEALHKAKRIINVCVDDNTECRSMIACIQELFPELKESEDERIKGNIIATIHLYYGEPLEDKAKEMIAWLEKQGQTFTKKDVDDAYLKGVCDAKQELEKQGEHQQFNDNFPSFDEAQGTVIIEKQGKQKTANKVEPKFHEGECLYENEPNNYAHFIQILEIVNVQGKDRYRISRDIHEDEDVVEFGFVEKYYHKFDIQDAKKGDILQANKCTLIFDSLTKDADGNTVISSWYFCDNRKFYGIGTSQPDLWVTKDVVPATKEQRDTLFAKMKEAGYEWDADKKELKKIEQIQVIDYPDNLPKDNWELVHEFVNKFGRIPKDEDELNALVEYVLKRQKTAWSEEDELIISVINALINMAETNTEQWYYNGSKKVFYSDIRQWLKFLKERVQLKQEWSKEDETIAKALTKAANDNVLYGYIGKSKLLEWLKSIRDRYTWKPSDEQIEALLKLEEMHVLEHEKNQENAHLYMVVKSLREQLLKLREE